MPAYKKKGIQTAKIGVVIPLEIKEKLDLLAEARGWTVSQSAATAIEQWVLQEFSTLK